jgi:hypothetical protein
VELLICKIGVIRDIAQADQDLICLRSVPVAIMFDDDGVVAKQCISARPIATAPEG